MRVLRLTYLVAILFACQLISAQNAIPVRFLSDPSRSASVGAFFRDGKSFISLSDISRVLGIPTYRNSEALKFEMRGDIYTLKVSANNSFVVINDRQLNASIVQLPSEISYTEESFYAPTEDFLPLLTTSTGKEITYDRARQTIFVGGRLPILSVFDIAGIDFEEKSNGLLIQIRCMKKLTEYENWTKQIGDDTWLYLTIANARADIKTLEKIKPRSDIVKKILVFQYPTSVQLTFKLRGLINTVEPLATQGSNDIRLAIHTPTKEQAAERRVREYERNLERERSRWKLDVVVIDAGHGGYDPGTIGTGNTKEKDVALGIALKLGKLIENNLSDVNVVYTRETDDFVEVYRRGQIANQAGGKLFISIHCNSTPRKPSNLSGFEIYLLRPGKTDAAINVAERENAVVKLEEGYEKRYQELTEENFILVTMAQSAYVKYSEKFAGILQQEMGKRLQIENNGVRQAGFLVLVGASMPNVLIETGYLSNRNEEKLLKSDKGQQRLAEAIFSGVKRYKVEYEKSLSEGMGVGENSR